MQREAIPLSFSEVHGGGGVIRLVGCRKIPTQAIIVH